jgi:hypothetical protein
MTTADAVLNTETATIQTQINNVNATMSSQKRVVALNDSYSKKMAAYTRMMMVIVFALAIAVLLNILKSKFPIIPGAVVTIAYIILFSAAISYSMYVVSDVSSRESTDFDKLDLPPPAGVSKNNQKLTQNQTELGDMDLLPGYCIGKDCCSGALAWDDDASKCVSACSAGYEYTSANDAHTCELCSAGKSSSGGTTACASCGAGTYSAVGAADCTACPVDTYAAAGATECTACPVNTHAPANSTASSACVA